MARLNTTKSTPGPKPRFTPTEEDLQQIQAMAQRGMTQKHIAQRYGLSESAWYETKARNPQIQERFEKGRGAGIQIVISKLWDLIQKGDEKAMYYFLDRIAGFQINGLINITHNYDASQTTVNNNQINLDFSKLSETEIKTLVIQSLNNLSSKKKLTTSKQHAEDEGKDDNNGSDEP